VSTFFLKCSIKYIKVKIIMGSCEICIFTHLIKQLTIKKMATAQKKAVKKSAPAKKTAPAKKAVVTKKAATKKVAAPAPPRVTTVNVYLNFDGTCEKAFNFYKSVFGGEFGWLGRFKDMPPMDGKPIPKSEAKKIMHVSLPISKETVLMGSDTSDAMGPKPVAGTNFAVSVSAANRAEAARLFKSLSKGGKTTMPMADMFWGSYFGMLTDKFGINWMVSFDQNPM
jgi:PhnB protein